MLSAGLLLAALAVNVFRELGYRVLICFVVIFSTAFHTAFFDNAVSFNYYGTAAIANLCVILFLSLFSKSPLSTAIQVISLIGIVFNFIGYGMYEAGLAPNHYNAAMLMLMLAEFYRLMVRTPNDRVHDVCEDGRLHHGISIDDSFSNPTNKSRSK